MAYINNVENILDLGFIINDNIYILYLPNFVNLVGSLYLVTAGTRTQIYKNL